MLALVGGVAGVLFAAVLVLLWRSERGVRARLMGPMGLPGSRLEHALLDLHAVPKRRNLDRRVLRDTLSRHELRVRQRVGMSWATVAVIADHELRMTEGRASTLYVRLLTLARVLSFWVTTSATRGAFDEWYHAPSGEVVAVAHVIAKGDTIRGMWFYQRTAYSRCSLYFAQTRITMERALALGLRYVDAGPSAPSQRASKELLGFVFVGPDVWKSHYQGAFLEVPPAQDL